MCNENNGFGFELPEGEVITEETVDELSEWKGCRIMGYTNSPLVNYVKLSP